MTFRELELISFLSASLVHGSQAVLIGPYLRATQGIERTEARHGLVSVGHLFAWQFSNFVCVLLAALGLGYPSLPSKLGNLVRWSSLYATPLMLSYVVTHLRLYGRPSHPGLVKAVSALRYLLWPWLLVAVVSLIAEGTRLFPPVVPVVHTGWITLTLMLVFFVIFTIQGLQVRSEMGSSSLGRARRAGFIASGVAAVLMVLNLIGALGAFARLGPYFGLASMMTTVPFSIYLAYRYCQFPFMDVYIREAVTGLILVMGFAIFVATGPLLPSGLQALWFMSGAVALIFGKEPLARQMERRLLGYQETLEEQEERLGSAVRSLTELGGFRAHAESILVHELEAEWVTIGTNPRSDAVHRFELKGSASCWLTLGPRVGKRAYMSRQLRLARSVALQLAAQQEWLHSRDNERRRLVERHELRELTAKAEMRALQAQINPHFLFNTLNVLANLIQDNPERAERLTEQLAEVFRYALESTRREWVTLEEEVRFLQAYLDIERARFGERLRHHWSMEPAVETTQIAPMLLQPLVENAVRHGIAPALQGGDVWISAKLDTHHLVLQVEDSGVGMSAGSSKPGFGVGLNNVKERLLRCYGEGAEMVLEPRDPEGTRATLVLPVWDGQGRDSIPAPGGFQVRRRAIIVDDEPEARARLRRLLAEHMDRMEIVGEAGDGIAAISEIESLNPDLAFLDIEMPGLNGFQLFDSLPRESWPLIVFTTAYDQYAIRAFEVHALDYLLKPVTKDRLSECLSRLERLSSELSRSRLDRARREQRPLERLLARSGAKHVIVQVHDVFAFQADDKLVFARTPAGRFTLSVTLKELEDRLDAEAFCRVHRQTIIQLKHARELHALAGGHYLLRLSDGSEVEVGRSFSKDFRHDSGDQSSSIMLLFDNRTGAH